jgi:hypothetical protein
MASRHVLNHTNTGKSVLLLKDIILKAAFSNGFLVHVRYDSCPGTL